MALTDKQIEDILVQNVETKTLLTDISTANSIKDAHIQDGWKVVNEMVINQKLKITFQRPIKK